MIVMEEGSRSHVGVFCPARDAAVLSSDAFPSDFRGKNRGYGAISVLSPISELTFRFRAIEVGADAESTSYLQAPLAVWRAIPDGLVELGEWWNWVSETDLSKIPYRSS